MFGRRPRPTFGDQPAPPVRRRRSRLNKAQRVPLAQPADPTRPVRTVLVDVTTDTQRGFWDAPLWMPIGGVVEGGDDLWEIVSVRLRLPTASPEEGIRPVLYLYARKAEA
jgi:hypothetical protein